MKTLISRLYCALKGQIRAILHDEGVVLILLFAPLIYGVIYSLCYAPGVVRELSVAVVDLSQSPLSRHLIERVEATSEVEIYAECSSFTEAKALLEAEQAHGILLIPRSYAEGVIAANGVRLPLFLDTSYFLLYRTLMEGLSKAILYTGAEVEVMRLSLSGVPLQSAEVVAQPLRLHPHNLYNPSLSYALFILPAILLLILQQTIWVGIGMHVATLREGRIRGRFRPSEHPVIALLSLLGALLLLTSLPALYLFTLHYRLFHLPMRGAWGAILLLLLLYLSASILSGRAIASLFRRRIDPLLWLLWSSIPILMLSGASLPTEAIPRPLHYLAALLPFTPAIRAFVALQSMGARLSELLPELLHLLLLLLLYGFLALYAIKREHRTLVRCSRRRQPIAR